MLQVLQVIGLLVNPHFQLFNITSSNNLRLDQLSQLPYGIILVLKTEYLREIHGLSVRTAAMR